MSQEQLLVALALHMQKLTLHNWQHNQAFTLELPKGEDVAQWFEDAHALIQRAIDPEVLRWAKNNR